MSVSWDFFFTELYNICDNVPSTIILILISYVASPSVQTLILGMSITGWIAMARFIRNQILIIRDRDYNVASRCIGTPTSRIVVRNLLPYLVSVIMLRMALTIPAASAARSSSPTSASASLSRCLLWATSSTMAERS